MKKEGLKEQYEAYKAEHPNKRIRDIAIGLGVSEMEVLEISAPEQLVYLGDNFKAILLDMHQLKDVMALTRNEHAVHETKGHYSEISFMEKVPMGIAHSKDIDLRYFMKNWGHVYAVTFQSGKRTMRSIQIFDVAGEAVHKIYTTPKSDLEAYETLVQKYQTTARNTPLQNLKDSPEQAATDEPLDLGAFQTAWLNMKDTHDFFALLRKHGLSRQEAFRVAPEGTTYQVAPTSVTKLLEQCAQEQVPIMVFVGNGGCLQIYSGPIKKVLPMKGWYNIMDPKFNLHLKLDGIDEAWVVKKYTSDGIVTSLELFDAVGNQILYLFGERKPGIPELETWRKQIAQLPKLQVV